MAGLPGGLLWLAAISPSGADLFRACTGRTSLPVTGSQFAYLVIGRRGGKSFAMAIIAVFLALFRDWRPYLSPGERAVILLVAADREQAKILHRYIVGILRSAPLLAKFIESETVFSLELAGGVAIEVATRSFRTVRGRSVAVALLDEIAFWPADEESASPDVSVVNAVRASQATFGDAAVLIAASSPYARRGVLWDAWRKFYGHDDARTLVWQAATRVMNPTVEQSFIDAEFERDQASAASEYDATFRTDIAQFISREVVEACTVIGRYELPPSSRNRYVAFGDPSGGSADSFTLAIAHREGPANMAILDAIREHRPPFSPDAVCQEFAALLKSYHLTTVTMDRYGGDWPASKFREYGIKAVPADKPRSDIYVELLPLLNGRRIELLDHQRLIGQLVGLERRTATSGRDMINHAPGAHDDVINAAAGALVLAGAHRTMFISDALVARARMPGPVQYRRHVPVAFNMQPSGPPIVLQPDQFGSTSIGDGLQ